ncbi:MAG: ethylbenzene dehydrogenase-related protein [Tepidiformaceae bacterium]
MSTVVASSVVAVRIAPSKNGSLDPTVDPWHAAQEIEAPLEPTPLEAQPSAYVRTAWADRKHGATPSVRAAAAVADGVLHVRLRWAALNPRPAITDNNVFADACALLFPLDGMTAELSTMGDEAHPVQAWHWRAGTAVPFVVEATGLATTTRLPNPQAVSVEAVWNGGEWSVVLSRALDAPGVPLRPGTSVPLGIAIWQGALEERAGLASHTPRWLALELPA